MKYALPSWPKLTAYHFLDRGALQTLKTTEPDMARESTTLACVHVRDTLHRQGPLCKGSEGMEFSPGTRRLLVLRSAYCSDGALFFRRIPSQLQVEISENGSQVYYFLEYYITRSLV